MVTPTTKAADHDEPISPDEIVARGLMSQADLDQVRSIEMMRASASMTLLCAPECLKLIFIRHVQSFGPRAGCSLHTLLHCKLMAAMMHIPSKVDQQIWAGSWAA